jgi:hypothetical protein
MAIAPPFDVQSSKSNEAVNRRKVNTFEPFKTFATTGTLMTYKDPLDVSGEAYCSDVELWVQTILFG